MWVDDLGLVMSLAGSVFSNAVAFIFPPLCALKMLLQKRRRSSSPADMPSVFEFFGPAALLMFGVAALFVGTAFTLTG